LTYVGVGMLVSSHRLSHHLCLMTLPEAVQSQS